MWCGICFRQKGLRLFIYSTETQPFRALSVVLSLVFVLQAGALTRTEKHSGSYRGRSKPAWRAVRSPAAAVPRGAGEGEMERS